MRSCADCGKPSGTHRWCWRCAEKRGGGIIESMQRKKAVKVDSELSVWQLFDKYRDPRKPNGRF